MMSTHWDEGMGFAFVDGGFLWDSFLFHIVPVAIPQGRISVSFCVPILVVVVVVDTSTSRISFLKDRVSIHVAYLSLQNSRRECLGCLTTACSLRWVVWTQRYVHVRSKSQGSSHPGHTSGT